MLETIFERLERSYPSLARQVVSWEEKGRSSILATLEDGSVVEYNELLDCIRNVVPYDATEESCKREFSHNLMVKMEEKGFNQIYLAEVSGVSQQSISDYIHRKKLPTIFIADKLARALRCDVSELVSF